MNIANRKLVLITLISISYIFVIAAAGFPVLPQSPDVYDYALALGGYLGILGTMLLWWQYLIGFRGLVARFVPDVIFLNQLHQRMGKYGFLQIALHPILIIIGYERPLEYWLVPQFSTPTEVFIRFGTVGFFLLTIVWLSSALLRGKLGFRWWKRIHFISYLVLPFILLHSYNVGFFVNNSQVLKGFWTVLIALYIAILLYRLAFQIGFTRAKYRLAKKIKVTHNVFRYEFEPIEDRFALTPEPGQFAYLQPEPFAETHPYTISHYDAISNRLSFTVKQAGPATTKLADMTIGKQVFVDGPYGVFTREMYTSELQPVYIAGGIGITPFMANWGYINQNDLTYLFYGNQTQRDIAYEQEINSNERIKAVHVLDKEEVAGYAHGFITLNLLKQHLGEDLSKYGFFVCGPAPMMNAVGTALLKGGVSSDQIYFEEFAL